MQLAMLPCHKELTPNVFISWAKFARGIVMVLATETPPAAGLTKGGGGLTLALAMSFLIFD
jgi:hypothetical protein